MSKQYSHFAIVPLDKSGHRFDQVAVDLFPEFSRSRIQSWIRSGELTLDGRMVKPNLKLVGGEHLSLQAEVVGEGQWLPEDIPIQVIYEDDSIIVINKPADWVVHPAPGNWQGTLLNALLFHYPELLALPRAGIVHRLDKDTSGLMVVARTLEAQTNLVKQLQAHDVARIYHALVYGEPPQKGVIDANIGRHPMQRTKMAVVESGKPARTHYLLLNRLQDVSYVQLALETGRTHQIRVHMAHMGFPLLGDPVYGAQKKNCAEGFQRQALHAVRLGLKHPSTGEAMSWECPLAEDFAQLLEHLQENPHG